MSADNWAKCPKCAIQGLERKRKEISLAAESYGEVDQQEFLKRLETAREPLDLRETLREDYWIGVDESGEFLVSYSCFCDKCGLRYEFKHKELLPDKSSKRCGVGNQQMDNEEQ